MTLSLPAKWAKETKVGPGDELYVEQKDSQLIISAEVIKRKLEKTIQITEENKHDIRPILTHLYRKGFDIITLKGINKAMMRQITELTKELLLGFEVTERGKDYCKITNISEPTEEKYPVLLRRAFLIIKETQQITYEDSIHGNYSRMSEIEELRNQQDKFIIFCRRILMGRSEKRALIHWELLTFLMHIQHGNYYLYKYAAENKIKKNKQISELLKELQNYFSLYYDAFYKKDINLIHAITRKKDQYQYGKCYDCLINSRGKETVIFSHMRELFRLIQIGTSPILSGLLRESLNLD